MCVCVCVFAWRKEATLINFLNANLRFGQNLIDAFKNPVPLKETADEVRYVKKCLLLVDMFRGRLLKKERELLKAPGDHPGAIAPITTPSAPPEEPKRLWEAEGVDDANRNAGKQPFCYVCSEEADSERRCCSEPIVLRCS